MLKAIKSGVIVIAVLFVSVFAYARLNAQPCSEPIKYSLGTIDEGFKLSNEQFLVDINQAADVWSSAINKNLFEYDPEAKLKISLVYDYRQQSTDELKKLGLNIENTQESYNEIRTRYQTMKSEYELKKPALDAEIKDYEKKQNAYNQKVAYWNNNGGAPKKEYQELQKEKSALDAQRSQIATQQDNLNKLIDDLNNLVNALNLLAKNLNLNISEYNNVGTSRGSQFEEGVYVEDSSGKRIDIFEFENQTQLIRLLAHELGHALGIDHVDDENAIMYKLNSGDNLALAAADLTELVRLCRVK